MKIYKGPYTVCVVTVYRGLDTGRAVTMQFLLRPYIGPTVTVYRPCRDRI